MYAYVRTAVLNKLTCAMTCAVSFLVQPYLEPLTFAWQRCLLQREYFDFVCLHFH